MKTKFLLSITLLCYVFLSSTISLTAAVTPTTAPYFGTAAYPYWGKYVETPMANVKAATWMNQDNVTIGWDWSLPGFVKLPQKSYFTLARVTGLNVSNINALPVINFPAKYTVTHWIQWKDLEAVKDKFTFEQLISNIKLAYSKGYKSIVRIHSSATTFAPAWVNTDIGAPILAKQEGAQMQNYDVADPLFHARYLKLVDAIGKSGIPHMIEVEGLYVGYASKSNGDEGIGPYHNTTTGNDTVKHVKERLDAWAAITVGVREKVYMGGLSNYGMSLNFGTRRGFVEMYLYQIPNSDIGQLMDNSNYLYIDEANPIIANNLFHGEENEEYDAKWATASNGFRFGTSTESFPYRYFTSNIRLLQMRCNEVLIHNKALMPEMLAWVGQELGRTVDEAPDVWSFLRESYLKANGGIPVKNFERWLYQRDTTGYTTTPAVKIDQAIQMWMVQTGKYYDYIAREGKKIGFNIDKNWTGVKDSLAFKVSVFDHNAGTLNLKFSNGNEIITLSKPLLGDSLLKTYTFFVPKYKNGANIGAKFDFTLEAGDNTKSIIVSFVRVVQAGTINQSTSLKSVAENSKITISHDITSRNFHIISESKINNVTIYNTKGQVLKKFSAKNNKLTISSSKLPAGSYIILVNDVLGNAERIKVKIE